MIVRVPELYQHLAPGAKGSVQDRMVSFIDLAPTLLNIAGAEIPEYMQGTPFLGPGQEEDPPYVYTFRGRMDERYDFSRGTFSEDLMFATGRLDGIGTSDMTGLWSLTAIDLPPAGILFIGAMGAFMVLLTRRATR